MAKASADAVERPAAKRRTAATNFFDLGREEWRPLVWPPGEKSSSPPLRHRRSRRQPAFATIRQIEIAWERNEHEGANDGDGKFTLSEKQRHRLEAPHSSTCGRCPTAEDNAGKRSSRRVPRGFVRDGGAKHGDRRRAKNRLMRLSRAGAPVPPARRVWTYGRLRQDWGRSRPRAVSGRGTKADKNSEYWEASRPPLEVDKPIATRILARGGIRASRHSAGGSRRHQRA
jgi:hypothetical protein